MAEAIITTTKKPLKHIIVNIWLSPEHINFGNIQVPIWLNFFLYENVKLLSNEFQNLKYVWMEPCLAMRVNVSLTEEYSLDRESSVSDFSWIRGLLHESRETLWASWSRAFHLMN